jgi:hypothetical protein
MPSTAPGRCGPPSSCAGRVRAPHEDAADVRAEGVLTPPVAARRGGRAAAVRRHGRLHPGPVATRHPTRTTAIAVVPVHGPSRGTGPDAPCASVRAAGPAADGPLASTRFWGRIHCAADPRGRVPAQGVVSVGAGRTAAPAAPPGTGGRTLPRACRLLRVPGLLPSLRGACRRSSSLRNAAQFEAMVQSKGAEPDCVRWAFSVLLTSADVPFRLHRVDSAGHGSIVVVTRHQSHVGNTTTLQS